MHLPGFFGAVDVVERGGVLELGVLDDLEGALGRGLGCELARDELGRVLLHPGIDGITDLGVDPSGVDEDSSDTLELEERSPLAGQPESELS